MNKALIKFAEIGNRLWKMPGFVVVFLINSLALILKITHKLPMHGATGIDYMELGALMVFLLELYLQYRKPKKEEKKQMIGHASTCRNQTTCKCQGEY